MHDRDRERQRSSGSGGRMGESKGLGPSTCVESGRQRQIELMLARLPMSAREREFVLSTAEKMVDLVCDEYVKAVKKGHVNPQCIAAAATAAMMIVDDS